MTHLFLSIVLFLPLSAQAEEREIAYAEIAPALTAASKKKSPLLDIKMSIEVLSETVALEQVKVWLIRDDEMVSQIPLNPKDGAIQLPTMTKKQAKRHSIRINQPKEMAHLNFAMTVRPPSSTHVEYRDLFSLVDDSNLFIKAMAGKMALFAPKVDALTFHFTEAATITIEADGNALHFENGSDLTISIKQSSELMTENPMVIFSGIPAAIEPL
jgi:hypothetical protein